MANIKIGTVVSTKMNKTAVVQIKAKIKHPLYKKQITRTTKLKAQNEIGAQNGQKVKIYETKPIAKSVNFKIKEVLK